MTTTIKNLEAALAGESMAHIKYRYFARIAREEGHEEVARHFEETADQEIKHAWGHLELLLGDINTRQALEKAIEGETFEYTTMYPDYERIARQEGNLEAAYEMQAQTEESKQHAQEFMMILRKAEKRFAALKKVEERHANAYKKVLGDL
jgi:rubrerythrin